MERDIGYLVGEGGGGRKSLPDNQATDSDRAHVLQHLGCKERTARKKAFQKVLHNLRSNL
jgi:hypothetical protein